jgi:hypothetical protein
MHKNWDDFWCFVADMGERPDGYTIERIDNDGDYGPQNCKWASRKEQQLNRCTAVYITVNGEKHRVFHLAQQSGLKPDTIIARAKKLTSLEEIISPERRVNTDGLRLGGIANGLRNKSKTHCKHGHEYTPENTAPNGKDGKGRACRRCHADRQLKRMHLLNKKAALGGP